MSSRHIVLFSGGLASWRVADILINEQGVERESVILLFNDTKIEDEDLYRFMAETTEQLGVPITEVSDGRDPWEVFFDVKYLGNTRYDPCSKFLKRDVTRQWLADHGDPERDIIYVGFDVFEEHRYERAVKHWEPWDFRAPLVNRIETRPFILRRLEEIGIAPPRLYAMGFSHNNCGGACVKAGQGHWANLYKNLPEVYDLWEKNEAEFRRRFSKDVSILRDFTGGKTTPLTLEELRHRIDSNGQVDMFDVRGCGCFSPGTKEADIEF